jgi:hypothetical protein
MPPDLTPDGFLTRDQAAAFARGLRVVFSAEELYARDAARDERWYAIVAQERAKAQAETLAALRRMVDSGEVLLATREQMQQVYQRLADDVARVVREQEAARPLKKVLQVVERDDLGRVTKLESTEVPK